MWSHTHTAKNAQPSEHAPNDDDETRVKPGSKLCARLEKKLDVFHRTLNPNRPLRYFQGHSHCTERRSTNISQKTWPYRRNATRGTCLANVARNSYADLHAASQWSRANCRVLHLYMHVVGPKPAHYKLRPLAQACQHLRPAWEETFTG